MVHLWNSPAPQFTLRICPIVEIVDFPSSWDPTPGRFPCVIVKLVGLGREELSGPCGAVPEDPIEITLRFEVWSSQTLTYAMLTRKTQLSHNTFRSLRGSTAVPLSRIAIRKHRIPKGSNSFWNPAFVRAIS